jgi:hypothetical protein
LISFLANTVLILLALGLLILTILLATLPFPLNGLVVLFVPGWILVNHVVAKMEESIQDAEARTRQAKYWRSLEPKLSLSTSEDNAKDHT